MEKAEFKKQSLIGPLIIGVALLVVLAAFYYFLCDQCVSWEAFHPQNIRNLLLSFGPLALVAYIVLYAINTVTLFPPIGIMSLTAGAVFGPWLGALGIMAGSFLGTTATFVISRRFGSGFVEGLLKGKAADFKRKLERNGFKVILLIRLIPVLPWEVVNYASGLSKIKYRDFILGTLIGIFPSVMIQTYFSHSVVFWDWKDPKIYLAIAAFVLLLAVPAVFIRLQRKEVANGEV